MIVKDLFDKIDFETLWDYFYNERIKEDDDTIEQIKNSKLYHEYAYLKIKKIEPLVNKNNILIFTRVVDDLYDEDEYEYNDVTLYYIDDIVENFKEELKIENNFDFSKLSKDEISKYIDKEKNHIVSYCFEFSPWNEILGYTLEEDSLKQMGEIEALSAIFYEMTFCGIDEEEIQAEADELKNRAEEVEKAIEKNDNSKFISLSEFFKEIGFIDERTEEEKDKDLKKMYLDTIENWKRIYPFLKNIKKKHITLD